MRLGRARGRPAAQLSSTQRPKTFRRPCGARLLLRQEQTALTARISKRADFYRPRCDPLHRGEYADFDQQSGHSGCKGLKAWVVKRGPANAICATAWISGSTGRHLATTAAEFAVLPLPERHKTGGYARQHGIPLSNGIGCRRSLLHSLAGRLSKDQTVGQDGVCCTKQDGGARPAARTRSSSTSPNGAKSASDRCVHTL